MQDAQYQTPPVGAPGVSLVPAAVQQVPPAKPAADEAASELQKVHDIRMKLEEEYAATVKAKEQFESATQAAKAAAEAAASITAPASTVVTDLQKREVPESKPKEAPKETKETEVMDLTGKVETKNQDSKTNAGQDVVEVVEPPNSGGADGSGKASVPKASVAKAAQIPPPPKVAPKEGTIPKTLQKTAAPSPPPPPPPPPSTGGQTS